MQSYSDSGNVGLIPIILQRMKFVFLSLRYNEARLPEGPTRQGFGRHSEVVAYFMQHASFTRDDLSEKAGIICWYTAQQAVGFPRSPTAVSKPILEPEGGCAVSSGVRPRPPRRERKE